MKLSFNVHGDLTELLKLSSQMCFTVNYLKACVFEVINCTLNGVSMFVSEGGDMMFRIFDYFIKHIQH